MKKLITLVLLVLYSFSIFAQEEHLTFKNIPIDGPLTQFLGKLKAGGFTQFDRDTDGVWLLGKFAGKDCKILVQSSATSQTVYAVYALFVNRNDWGMAKMDYNTLKEALSRKYGQPQSKEEFESPYKEDGYEFMHMKDGHVIWLSEYSTPNGLIRLYIKEQGVSEGCAITSYRDRLNYEKSIAELSDEL